MFWFDLCTNPNNTVSVLIFTVLKSRTHPPSQKNKKLSLGTHKPSSSCVVAYGNVCIRGELWFMFAQESFSVEQNSVQQHGTSVQYYLVVGGVLQYPAKRSGRLQN